MRIHGSLLKEPSPELMAMLQSRRCHGEDCGSPGKSNKEARQLVMGEVGRRLGLDFSNVTHAMRTLLVRASAEGQDGVPQVLDKVNQALTAAGKSLREAGLSEEQVTATLKDVRTQLSASLSVSAETAAAQDAIYARKDKANLSITTQDGDKVRVRFQTREGFAADDNAIAEGEERRVYASSSGKVQISVDGELSEDELQAIGELVAKVETLAKDFFAGDVQKAFAAAAKLGFDGEQIASFALKLTSREMRRQAEPVDAAAKPPTRPIAQPVTQPVTKPTTKPVSTTSSSTPVPVTAAPKSPTAASPVATTPVATTPVAAPAAPSTTTAPVEATPPPAIASTIADFFRRIMDVLESSVGSSRFEFSMEWKLKLVIDAVEANEPKLEPTPATQLLTTSLQVLGEQLPAVEAVPAAETQPGGKTDLV